MIPAAPVLVVGGDDDRVSPERVVDAELSCRRFCKPRSVRLVTPAAGPSRLHRNSPLGWRPRICTLADRSQRGVATAATGRTDDIRGTDAERDSKPNSKCAVLACRHHLHMPARSLGHDSDMLPRRESHPVHRERFPGTDLQPGRPSLRRCDRQQHDQDNPKSTREIHIPHSIPKVLRGAAELRPLANSTDTAARLRRLAWALTG